MVGIADRTAKLQAGAGQQSAGLDVQFGARRAAGKLWGNASFNMTVPASAPLVAKEAPPRALTVSPARGRSPPSFPAPPGAVNGRKATRIEDGPLRA